MTNISCLIGVHFIVAPFSFIWVYGNLSVYIDSYVRFSSSDTGSADTQWTLPLYVACFCPGLLLVNPLVKRVGLKLTGILSMFFFNAAMVGSAWTIQFSVVSTIVLQSIVMGMTVSISVCISYVYVHSWRPKYESILIASVSCSSNLLSMLENQLITQIVNPHNLKPDKMTGLKMYFSQMQILEQVPRAIVMLGGLTLGMQIVGYFLVKTPSPKESDSSPYREQTGYKFSTQENNQIKLFGKTCEPSASDPAHIIQIDKNYVSGESITRQCNIPNKVREDVCEKTFHLSSYSSITDGERGCDLSTLDVHSTVLGLTPFQVVQTSYFWILWLSWVALIYSLMLKNCFYKQFGLVHIHNDHGLTFLGTFTPLITSVSRILFGYCLDKGILGVSGCLVMGLSSSSVLCAFWFLAGQVSEALYDILILCLSGMVGVFYVVFPTAILRIFGPAHFSSVLAMLYSASTISGIAVAFFATPFLNVFGWFWIFASGSFLNVVALLGVYMVNLNVIDL